MKKLILTKLDNLNHNELRKIKGGLILLDYNDSGASGGDDINRKKDCTCTGTGLNSNLASGCYCSDSSCSK